MPESLPCKERYLLQVQLLWTFWQDVFLKNSGKASQRHKDMYRPSTEEDNSSTETSHWYLDAISDQPSGPTTAWHICIIVNNAEVVFKINTGAEVTAISKKVYDTVDKPRLLKPTKIICGPSSQPLDVLGCTTVHLRYKQNTIRHQMCIVKTLNQNFLGLSAITALNILTKVDALNDSTSNINILTQFPELLQGLGTMKAEYEIKLK